MNRSLRREFVLKTGEHLIVADDTITGSVSVCVCVLGTVKGYSVRTKSRIGFLMDGVMQHNVVLRIQRPITNKVTGKLYKFLNLAKKVISQSTSRRNKSSKFITCPKPIPQSGLTACSVTEVCSGAVSQRGQGWLPLP